MNSIQNTFKHSYDHNLVELHSKNVENGVLKIIEIESDL
jgi:hypothetical protein